MNFPPSSKPPTPVVVALAWFRPEQWRRLREMSVDRAELEADFAQWEATAQHKVTELEAAGYRVEKVVVDVEALRRWCKRRKRPADGQARAAYAIERFKKRKASQDE